MKSILLIGGLVTGLSFGCATSTTSTKTDLDRMQGTWALISAERDGNPAPPGELRNARLIVEGNRFSFSPGSTVGTAARGTFTLNPEARPPATDSTSASGEVSAGIYEIRGDTHRICFAPPGKPRPTTLAAPRGSGQILQVWKRVAP